MKKNTKLDQLLGIQMSRTMLEMKALLVSEFESKKQQLSFEEWMNLLTIVENPTLTQKTYAMILGKDKTTISRMLKSWETKGIIKRETSPNDGRAVSLRLSEKARKYHEEGKPIVFAIDRIFKESLTPKEERELSVLLQKIKERTEIERKKRLSFP